MSAISIVKLRFQAANTTKYLITFSDHQERYDPEGNESAWQIIRNQILGIVPRVLRFSYVIFLKESTELSTSCDLKVLY